LASGGWGGDGAHSVDEPLFSTLMLPPHEFASNGIAGDVLGRHFSDTFRSTQHTTCVLG
jgi:hypothetical protein